MRSAPADSYESVKVHFGELDNTQKKHSQFMYVFTSISLFFNTVNYLRSIFARNLPLKNYIYVFSLYSPKCAFMNFDKSFMLFPQIALS